jgi:ADP-heptose:LPS heptosyltransferase
MFATPVAKLLKQNYPDAYLTYWTHKSTGDLLKLCPYVDRILPYDKDKLGKQRKALRLLKPDLVVDLVSNLTSKLITLGSGAKVLRLKKTSDLASKHIVDNMLETLAPLNLKVHEPNFPTLVIEKKISSQVEALVEQAKLLKQQLLAVVPAVGVHRPNRAWSKDNWLTLLNEIMAGQQLAPYALLPVLVGGQEDLDFCQEIAVEAHCPSLAGKLTLVETAKLLKSCVLTVSGDTGPAHMSVAIGTPVVGLYGATYKTRNGPYGYLDLAVDHSNVCECLYKKTCRLTKKTGPGQCMDTISGDEVLAKMKEALGRYVRPIDILSR